MIHPKLVIFDMDGLIFDTERLYMELMTIAAKPYNYEVTMEFYEKTLGTNGEMLRQVTMDHFGAGYPYDEIEEQTEQSLYEYAQTKPMPVKKGVRELLDHLKSSGITCCVASSSDREMIEAFLGNAGLFEYFSFAIGGNMVENTKPSPDVFLKALAQADIKPEEALVLEDSENGILAAAAAGIPVICIPDMKVPEKTYAEKTYAVLEDLTKIIPLL